MAIWCQNLPEGRQVKCGVGPITALPMLTGKFENPAITIAGVTMVFPVELTSGNWLEYNGSEGCTLFGPKGEVLSKIVPSGGLLTLRPGRNEVQFSCKFGQGPSPRIKVTVFAKGEELRPAGRLK